ncbi:NAD 5'-nucleotidase [Desulfosarcina ovata subsp. ovata]|uniref:NAD 5'-nucleotidase n=2 Tax=Desulfosarcina ovata TaxID=83564 RepID=A0A5K8AIS9_9BACT|nr:NAD 5'-nucleotidase [Desulfosarcina ovata subsp. ovata]
MLAMKPRILIGIILLLTGVMSNACTVADHKAHNARERIKILHINDVHSHLESGSIDLKIAGIDTACEVGGMGRVAAIIADLRANNDNTLVLHAGDAVQGTYYYTLFNGEADARVMNAIGFDAMTIGNHEFDDGDEWLAGFIERLDAPVISANIDVADGNILNGRFSPYVIKRVAGKDIGIVGITIAAKTKASSQPSDAVTFHDEAASLRAAVDALKALGIGRIVVLSHYGYRNAIALAGQVGDIDVIVDGDSHTLLGDFSMYGLRTDGAYPTMASNADGDAVCIVQAWEYSKVLGELDVTFAGDVVDHCSGTPHLILGDTFMRENTGGQADAVKGADLSALQAVIDQDRKLDGVADDTAVAEIIAGYAEKMGLLANTVIGKAGEDLLHGRVPGKIEDGVVLQRGSDIAPLVAQAFYVQDPNADISIQNAGGVRISLRAGDMTYDTAYTLLPFSNTLFEIRLYGTEIRQVLEDAIENIAQGGSTGSFPYCYGLKFDVDATQAYGSRVSNLEVRDRTTGTYSDLGDDTMYVVVTNDYTAAGRDGYDTFATVQERRGRGTDTYLDYAMSFVNHVRSLTAAGKPLVKLPAADHCIKSYIPTTATGDNL